MDRGAWKAAVNGVAEGQTQLSDFTFTFMHWRRKWKPTPVFLPGESQGQGSLVGCRVWGRTELDATEATWQQQDRHQCEGWRGATSALIVAFLLSWGRIAFKKFLLSE